jgi:hypothetical protein
MKLDRVHGLLDALARRLAGRKLSEAEAVILEERIRGLLRTIWACEAGARPPALNPVSLADATEALKRIYSSDRLERCVHYPAPESCGPIFEDDPR